jgi:hypothetical protein
VAGWTLLAIGLLITGVWGASRWWRFGYNGSEFGVGATGGLVWFRHNEGFVDTTGGSFPFLKALSAPGRVIITATGTYGQKYDTVFADAFIKALTDPVADADKNGRISLLEAFTYASTLVKQYYDQKGQLSTENAVFNDTGDGSPQNKAVPGQAAGTVAGLTYLDAVAAPTSSNPEVQQLMIRQQQLTQQVDDLRRRRPAMTPEAFDQEFEKLIVELALVSRDVRRRAGG